VYTYIHNANAQRVQTDCFGDGTNDGSVVGNLTNNAWESSWNTLSNKHLYTYDIQGRMHTMTNPPAAANTSGNTAGWAASSSAISTCSTAGTSIYGLGWVDDDGSAENQVVSSNYRISGGLLKKRDRP
jgi:hypothetical protein